MRTLSADPGDKKVRQLIEAARTEPVALLEDGEPAAIVLSPSEFDRLDAQDRIRREATARLRQTIAAMHAEAKARGLTDEEADRLVADAKPLVPNAETIEAMEEARRGGHKGFRTIDELMTNLNAED